MKQAHEQAPEASPVWAPVILEGFWFRVILGLRVWALESLKL